MIKCLRWHRWLFLSIISLLLVVNEPSLLTSRAANKEAQHSQAQFLTKKGLEQLNRDQALQALETWKKAEKIYRQIKFNDGIIGSLINQSLALKSLGLYPRTCNKLLDALKMDRWICSSTLEQPTQSIKEVIKVAIYKINPTSLNLLGLQKLGDALRLIGKLDESETVLNEILLIAQTVIPKQDVSSVLFSLANTKESMYERLKNQYKWIGDTNYKKQTINQIQQNALFSLDYYRTNI